VDGVEHCTFVTRSGVHPDPRSETVDAIAEAGVFVGCTGRSLPAQHVRAEVAEDA
jgi:hypothetical protein